MMTGPNRRDAIDPTDPNGTTARDPDRHSTWNTIDGSIDVEDVVDEEDLENFLVDPIPNPLEPGAPPDAAE